MTSRQTHPRRHYPHLSMTFIQCRYSHSFFFFNFSLLILNWSTTIYLNKNRFFEAFNVNPICPKVCSEPVQICSKLLKSQHFNDYTNYFKGIITIQFQLKNVRDHIVYIYT